MKKEETYSRQIRNLKYWSGLQRDQVNSLLLCYTVLLANDSTSKGSVPNTIEMRFTSIGKNVTDEVMG